MFLLGVSHLILGGGEVFFVKRYLPSFLLKTSGPLGNKNVQADGFGNPGFNQKWKVIYHHVQKKSHCSIVIKKYILAVKKDTSLIIKWLDSHIINEETYVVSLLFSS